MMQKLGNEVTDAEVKDIITESGSSKASGITYPEFQKLMGMGIKNLREPEDPEDELRHAFRLFDQDGDGEWHPNPDPNLNPNPGGRRRVGLLCCCSAHAAAPRRPWTLATATACPVAARAHRAALMPCRRINLPPSLPQGSSQPRSSARHSPTTVASKRPTRRWSRSSRRRHTTPTAGLATMCSSAS